MAYSRTLTATGAAGPFGFDVTAGTLPPGLALSDDGVFSGTPTTAGSYTFTVSATSQGGGARGSRSYSLSVAPAGTGGRPNFRGRTLTLSPPADGEAYRPGETVTVRHSVEYLGGGGAVTLETGFYLAPVAAGAGARVDTDDPIARGSVTDLSPGPSNTFTTRLTLPSDLTAGDYALGLIVDPDDRLRESNESDNANRGVGTDLAVLSVRPKPVRTPSIGLSPDELPRAVVGRPYSVTLTAAGAPGTLLIYRDGTDPLPPGLRLGFGSPQTLSGTPTAAGIYTFQLGATNAAGQFNVVTRTITVVAAGPPTVSGRPAQPVSLTEPRTVRLTVGDPLFAADRLTVTATSSDPGVAAVATGGGGANRTVTVSPGTPGIALITVVVTNPDGERTVTNFRVTVPAPPPPPPPPTGPLVVPADFLARFRVGPNPRAAAADLNGDGAVDFVVVAGPGQPNRVQVLDGRSNAVIASFAPFEGSFTGGLYVTVGDLGDGRLSLIVSPDEGGGPVVAVYDAGRLLAGDTTPAARFFGIDDPAFRGGCRPAVGVLNGTPALIVAAGFGGGPRVAVYDARDVLAGSPTPGRLVPDFFAFETALRNGAFVSAGDLNADGASEVVFGGGPGGAPRVRVIDGRSLAAAAGTFANLDQLPAAQRANFFAGDTAARDGVRVAVRPAADGSPAVAVQGGAGGPVRVFKANTLFAGSAGPAADETIDPAGGVFVG